MFKCLLSLSFFISHVFAAELFTFSDDAANAGLIGTPARYYSRDEVVDLVREGRWVNKIQLPEGILNMSLDRDIYYYTQSKWKC